MYNSSAETRKGIAPAVYTRLSASLWITIMTVLSAGAQSDHAVGRLAPLSDFPELPAAIAHDLANRGCRIPQVEGVPKRHNVIRGEFEKPRQRDWAALCLQRNTSIIFVYWNGSAKSPTPLAPLDETMSASKRGYSRILHVAGGKFIRNHYNPSASDLDPLPKVLDHDGIDVGIFGKGSSVHYFDSGKWLALPGSD
jgi:hypothetical protein